MGKEEVMGRRRLGNRISGFRIILAGFAAVILIGTGLLMLPAASRSGEAVPAGDALFTSVSAVCVTGLVVRDTALAWSGFGQAVILVLIQIGGLGVVTVAVLIAMASGRKISLMQRGLIRDSLSAHQLGGMVRKTGFVLKLVFLTELAGALAMMPAFCGEYGMHGVWMAVFHSVSAFCNAGFDIMGDRTGAYSSLTAFAARPGAVLPLGLLIVIGGLGFLTWEDIAVNRFRLRRYRMQTKVILAATAVLILLPAAWLFFEEYGAYPLGERIGLSLFQAVTPRTAGFNTADLAQMSGSSKVMLTGLMLIGGSPGSTAGGIKNTTAVILLANAVSVFRRRNHAQLFGRRLEDPAVKSASSLLLLYLFMTVSGALLISRAEGLPIGTCLFETASAIGTVGLSLGITPALGPLSRLVLISLMFFGRAGGLTVMCAALSIKSGEVSRFPLEKIAVG
ncbi:MAG: Trk family potassium uptake protein [Lachnospiraceae bacterium]|nr:Trk family potassium uptake protein [Lachnospiraceae bacterium]